MRLVNCVVVLTVKVTFDAEPVHSSPSADNSPGSAVLNLPLVIVNDIFSITLSPASNVIEAPLYILKVWSFAQYLLLVPPDTPETERSPHVTVSPSTRFSNAPSPVTSEYISDKVIISVPSGSSAETWEYNSMDGCYRLLEPYR